MEFRSLTQKTDFISTRNIHTYAIFYSDNCHVICNTVHVNLIFTSRNEFCWPCSWNVLELPEDDCLKAETSQECKSVNKVMLAYIAH
jgi:hypothetical protein